MDAALGYGKKRPLEMNTQRDRAIGWWFSLDYAGNHVQSAQSFLNG